MEFNERDITDSHRPTQRVRDFTRPPASNSKHGESSNAQKADLGEFSLSELNRENAMSKTDVVPSPHPEKRISGGDPAKNSSSYVDDMVNYAWQKVRSLWGMTDQPAINDNTSIELDNMANREIEHKKARLEKLSSLSYWGSTLSPEHHHSLKDKEFINPRLELQHFIRDVNDAHDSAITACQKISQSSNDTIWRDEETINIDKNDLLKKAMTRINRAKQAIEKANQQLMNSEIPNKELLKSSHALMHHSVNLSEIWVVMQEICKPKEPRMQGQERSELVNVRLLLHEVVERSKCNINKIAIHCHEHLSELLQSPSINTQQLDQSIERIEKMKIDLGSAKDYVINGRDYNPEKMNMRILLEMAVTLSKNNAKLAHFWVEIHKGVSRANNTISGADYPSTEQFEDEVGVKAARSLLGNKILEISDAIEKTRQMQNRILSLGQQGHIDIYHKHVEILSTVEKNYKKADRRFMRDETTLEELQESLVNGELDISKLLEHATAVAETERKIEKGKGKADNRSVLRSD